MRVTNGPALVIAEYGGLVLLTGAILALDITSPQGIDAWLLYLLPLALTFLLPGNRGPFYFCFLAAALLSIGHLLSQAGSSPQSDALNRLIGFSVMWLFVFVATRYSRSQLAFFSAESRRESAMRNLSAELTKRHDAERSQAVITDQLREAERGEAHAMTARLRVEEELLVSSTRLEGIVQSAMDAIISIDQEQRIILFNRAAEEMFLCTKDEVLGRPLDRFIPSRYRESHRSHISMFGQSGVSNRRMGALGVITGLRSNGEEFPIEAAISHTGATGEKIYTVILRDITERKSAEVALREAQDRFQDIFESSKDAIAYVSLDGSVVLANEAFAKLTGYSREELLSKTYGDLTPPEYRGIQAQEAARVFKTGEPVEYEKEFVQKGGSRVPVSVTLFLVKGSEAKPAGMAAIIRDITAQKRSEHLLQQSEARYRRLVEVSPDAILVHRDNRILLINRKGLELLGADDAFQILGRSPIDFIHPDLHEEARSRFRQLMEGEEEVSFLEQRFVRLDGTSVDVEVTVARFVDQEVPAVLAVVRDVTERKRMAERLQRTERIAELGTLASGMAHEIGTPMNVIMGRAEYLMNRTKEEPIKRGLQTIISQVERITRVMNQLLSFARRRTPERRAVDLKQVADNSLDIFEERFSRHNIHAELTCDKDIPPVHADVDQMNQVLINLVMNATHAMPEGGRLDIRLSANHDNVQLKVMDTGHGIPADTVPRIFDPFFTTKEFGKGTGLGLTVVKGIIDEHGGTITVESEEGKGTTFTVELPVYHHHEKDFAVD
ncbi:MAG: PAS domain S-box protein [Nitrospiraceae bacterium]